MAACVSPDPKLKKPTKFMAWQEIARMAKEENGQTTSTFLMVRLSGGGVPVVEKIWKTDWRV